MAAFLFARADVDAGEILRALRRFQLREMDDINRALAVRDEAFERLAPAAIPNRHIPAAPAGPCDETVTVGRPFSRVSSSSKKVVSPSVADISRKRACGKVNSGTCQATPRSRSA